MGGSVHKDSGPVGLESRRTPDYTLAQAEVPRSQSRRWTIVACTLTLACALTLFVSDVSRQWAVHGQSDPKGFGGLGRRYETELVPWGPGHASKAVQIRRTYSNSQIERILKAESDATAAALTLLRSIRKEKTSIRNPVLQEAQVQAKEDVKSMDNVLDALNHTHDKSMHAPVNSSSVNQTVSDEADVNQTTKNSDRNSEDADAHLHNNTEMRNSTNSSSSAGSQGNATNSTSAKTAVSEDAEHKVVLKEPPFHAATAPELKCFPVNEDGQIYEVTRSAVFCWYYPVWCQLNCRASSKLEGLDLLRARPRDYNSEGTLNGDAWSFWKKELRRMAPPPVDTSITPEDKEDIE